jgi:hypothetical protein
MKKLIALALILSLITLSLVSAETSPDTAYTALTRVQARAWLESITLEQLEDFVIKYDLIEHSVPVIDKFTYLAIVSGPDVYVRPVAATTTMTIGIGENSLKYKLELPSFTYTGLVPKPDSTSFRDGAIGAGIGLVVGGIIGAFVAGGK